jgi:23S rRNA pseudouridine955/2504/2580 synthase/23S rRNA pseudouridine1911/1915/1917 synthase
MDISQETKGNSPIKRAVNIIFENEYFVAVNKPSGLLTIPDRYDEMQSSLYKSLQQQYQKIYIVHRLDRDTSGIILFAKDEATHKYLSQLFEQRNVEKYYLGIIHGSPNVKKGLIDEPLLEHPSKKGMMVVHAKGKPSVTEYEILEDHGRYSLAKFRIHTGRTHQIRAHMKHIGHPLACDEIYGDGKPVLLSSFKKKFKLGKEDEERPLLNRLGLHAWELKFRNIDGKEFDLVADPPKDIRALLQQLKKAR